MVRADGAEYAGKREVDTLSDSSDFFGAGFKGFAALFDFGFDMRAELIEFLAHDALEFLSCGLEPIVRNLREHAGFAAEPRIAKLFPGSLVAGERTLRVEAYAKIGEERRKLFGSRDAELD